MHTPQFKMLYACGILKCSMNVIFYNVESRGVYQGLYNVEQSKEWD